MAEGDWLMSMMTLRSLQLKFLAAHVAAALFSALPALAFFPPKDAHDGVTARFIGFDEGTPGGAKWKPNDAKVVLAAKRDASAPFEIRLDIANTTASPVSGDLRIWLNDDWDIPSSLVTRHSSLTTRHSSLVTLPPHSTNSFFATAVPKPGRVLPALYPIHASFDFPGGDPLHPIAIFEATKSTKEHKDFVNSVSFVAERTPLPLRLALLPGSAFTQLPGAAPTPISEARETGAFFNRGWFAADGDLRFGFFSQPPWRTGGGFSWRDTQVALPEAVPLTLRFSTAIRSPLRAGEGRSDGADYKVFVVDGDGRATEVYSALVKSSSWADGEADLTPWAGRNVTIRLWNGCGPANDPNYDRCLWGDVGVFGGDAVAEGEQADNGKNASLDPGAPAPGRAALREMPLTVHGEAWTASFTPGPCGLLDGTLVFTDGERNLSFTGFTCAIDDITVGPGQLDARCTGFEVEASGDSGAQPPSFAILHRIDLRDGRAVVARATLRADGPALRISWNMPGVARSPSGSPRFTRLGIGPASLPAARAYMSFGNVLEKPRSFELTGGLFKNMASHAGADYANGASLCQAADGIPDRILFRRDANVFAVETAGDATFSFVPSARGAFAAARAWRDVSGVRRSQGWREAATRMCFDQWGNVANQNTNVTAALDIIGRYGVTNSIYVRHVWQRWGFDYRLPEIWPPGTWVGNHGTFAEMRETARRHGILFVLHDNYIDHYPDAAGFSYDDTVFDENGAPVKAWFNFNKGKRAQSYRWAPGAFMPALRANAAALRDGCAPDGTFLDVFSNMAPFDWFDRAGRFHDRAETRAAWGEAFDEYRRILGTNTVTIGEGGHDALIGHLDAGQPDHFTPARWMDRGEYADAERVPWHDIVSHGSLVLYGGGLGWRYASDSPDRGGDPEKGCTSDSYLCTTVIGGRTPLHDFDPSQINFRCVGTWWLLGDVTRALALSDFESFEFEGSIHRQHAVFSGESQVWVNRVSEPWEVSEMSLPKDGFYAETPDARAGIVEIAGRRCAFAASDNAIFVDGRPNRNDGTGPADVKNAQALADFAALGIRTDGAFRLERDGDKALTLTPVPDGGPFRVEIDLARIARLGATPLRSSAPAPVVAAVEPVGSSPEATPPDWNQKDGILSLTVDSKSFAYRISL